MAEIYEWPEELLPSKQSIRLKTNRKRWTSPFNGSTQNVNYPGSRWAIELEFESLDDYESRKLETLLYKLDNGGIVRVGDFGRAGTNQTGVRVFSDGQTGTTLVTQGWVPNQLICLEEGEYFEINGELKYITRTVGSDSAGRCTVEFAPMLRNSPQSGDPVEVRNPCGYFQLDQDEAGPNRMPAFNNAISLSLVEQFYPGLTGGTNSPTVAMMSLGPAEHESVISTGLWRDDLAFADDLPFRDSP
ncbi:MAG: hypothetical protein ACRDCY_18170 [Aeromonas veronii]